MTYYIESKSPNSRPVVLVRSTVRRLASNISQIASSGENTVPEMSDNTDQATNDDHASENMEISSNQTVTTNYHTNTELEKDDSDKIDDENNDNESLATDDAEIVSWDNDVQNEEDDALINEQISKEMNNSVEDMEFDYIKSYKWEDGLLMFRVVLSSEKI